MTCRPCCLLTRKKTFDRAVAPCIETIKKRIPSMTPKLTNDEVDKIDVPTVETSTKRSYTRASTSDFLEAFHLSILQDRQQREHNRELRERNRQD